MGTYINETELEQRFGAKLLTALTVEGSETTWDGQVLNAAIVDAEAELEAYVGRAYQLPLGQRPALLTRIAAELVRYHLHLRKSPGRVPEEVVKRYEAQVVLLKGIAKREVSLGVQEPVQPAGQAAFLASSPRTFSRRSMRGY